MANTLRFKRGLASGIPTGVAGEPLFTTDTFDLYIGNGTTNTRFQKYIASGTTSQLLRGDGSLLTMPIVLTSPANGEVLKYNGTNWVNSSDAGITGSGASGQVAYFTGATTQAGNNNLFWNNSSIRLGIGLNAPSTTFHTRGASSDIMSNIVTFDKYDSAGTDLHQLVIGIDSVTNYVNFYSTGNNNGGFIFTRGGTEMARFFPSTGNFGINTGASDSGQRLQVTGDTLLKGSGNTSGTNALLVENSDGSDLFIARNDGSIFLTANTGARIYPSIAISGVEIGATGLAFDGRAVTRTAASSSFWFFVSNNSTAATQSLMNFGGGFTPTSGTATWNSTLINTTINQTGGANGITRGLYVNPTLTAAADWRSIEWSNNTGWGLYGAGTAPNLLGGSLRVDGNVSIGSAPSTSRLLNITKNISGAVTSYGSIILSTVQSDVTNSARVYYSEVGTAAAAFTLPDLNHFFAVQGTFGAGSSVTNQYGFRVFSNLTGATNNWAFYGDLAAATGRWNLYMNGTATNYLNGSLLIGSTTDSGEKLQVTGTMKVTGATEIRSNLFIGVDSSANGRIYLYNATNTGRGELYYDGTNNYFRIESTYGGSGTFRPMAFWTGGALRATLDASGNLGLAVTPSATSGGYKNVQNGNAVMMGSTSDAAAYWNANATFNSGWKYIATGASSRYEQGLGSHYWFTAPTGTTGNAITFTQAMTLFATNNLAIGSTSDSGEKLQVNGTSIFRNDMQLSKTTASLAEFIINDGFTSSTTTESRLRVQANTTQGYFIAQGPLHSTYKIQGPGDVSIYKSGTDGNITILNDRSTGNIVMAAGGSSTAHFTIASTGAATFSSSVTAGGNLLLTNGTAASIGAINLIRTGTSPVASRMTFGTDGTGYQFAIAKNVTGTVTDLVTILDSGAATFSSSIQATTAIAIGTTPDTNNPFKILKNLNTTVGIKFENTNTSSLAFSAVQLGTDITGGTAFTNLVYGSSGTSEAGVFKPSGTALINTGSGGLNFLAVSQPIRFFTSTGNGTLRASITNDGDFTQFNGTNPSASTTDAFRMYSADVTAGNAAPHFRTENGAVIKLYQETTAVGNSTISVGGGSAVLDDTQFGGYTLRQVVKALQNQGILA